MALDLSYIAADDQLNLRLSQVDWDTFKLLGKSCPNEIEILTGVEDFGEPRAEKRAELLRAVQVVSETLANESDAIPYTYGYSFVGGMFDGDSGSGGTGGIQIGGDGFFYYIEGGVGQCVLEKHGIGPDGKGVVIERKDVRHLKSLKTDNLGEIKIWRKKKANRLEKSLTELKKFLLRNPDETITKILG
jgi:hypothetical protein